MSKPPSTWNLAGLLRDFRYFVLIAAMFWLIALCWIPLWILRLCFGERAPRAFIRFFILFD
jgi:hypothetical protein